MPEGMMTRRRWYRFGALVACLGAAASVVVVLALNRAREATESAASRLSPLVEEAPRQGWSGEPTSQDSVRLAFVAWNATGKPTTIEVRINGLLLSRCRVPVPPFRTLYNGEGLGYAIVRRGAAVDVQIAEKKHHLGFRALLWPTVTQRVLIELCENAPLLASPEPGPAMSVKFDPAPSLAQW